MNFGRLILNTRIGVLSAKMPLLRAEFKIWPLKSALEVTYFGNVETFITGLGGADMEI